MICCGGKVWRPSTPAAPQTQASGQPMQRERAFDGQTPKAKLQGAA
jgi:hypothetical protein